MLDADISLIAAAAAPWLPSLFFGLAFLISYLKEPRQFRNALFLLCFILSTALTGIYLSGHIGSFVVFVLLAIFLFPFVAVIGLVANTVVVVRKNGLSFSSLLPAALAGFIVLMCVAALSIDSTVMPLWGALLFLCFALEGLWFSFSYVALLLYAWFYRILPRHHRYDFIIVHGAGLMGTELTPLLAGRVDKAVEVWEHQKCFGKILVSGGQGRDEEISEAEAMKRYLVRERFVDPSDIIVEDASTTTMENLANSKAIIDAQTGGKPYRAAVVTSDYHVFRCAEYAHELGIPADGIGSHTRGWYWPASFTREFIAVTKAHLWPYLIIGALWIILAISASHGIYW